MLVNSLLLMDNHSETNDASSLLCIVYKALKNVLRLFLYVKYMQLAGRNIGCNADRQSKPEML